MQNDAISVGKLVLLTPEGRAARIRTLRLDVRMRLIYLASLGMRNAYKKAAQYREVIEALSKEQDNGM